MEPDMPLSPYAVDVALPEDLAEMLRDVSTNHAPVRSTLVTLLVDGSTWATAAITFLQGPPAVTYWVGVAKVWLRRKRDEGVGEIKVKGPNGTATFTITADTDLAELAGALHKAMFPTRPRPTRDLDDLAV
jgi:hypothetical protein